MEDNKRKIEVVLILFAVNHKEPGNTKVLLVKKDAEYSLPRLDVPLQISVEKTAATLLEVYTTIVANNWVTLKQLPVVEDNDILAIPFGAMIPETVAIKFNTEWVSILEVMQDGKLDDNWERLIHKAGLTL